MDGLTWFGLVAVTAMQIFYWTEDRSAWFELAFAEPARSLRFMAFCKGLAVPRGRGDLERRGAASPSPAASVDVGVV